MTDLHFKVSDYAPGITSSTCFVQTRRGVCKVQWEVHSDGVKLRNTPREKFLFSIDISFKDPNLRMYITESGESTVALLIAFGKNAQRVYLQFTSWLSFWRLWNFLREYAVVNQDVKRFFTLKTRLTETRYKTKVYQALSIKMQHPVLVHSIIKVMDSQENSQIHRKWRAFAREQLVCPMFEVYESSRSYVVISQSIKVMTLRSFLETRPTLGLVEVIEIVEALMMMINNLTKLFPEEERELKLDQLLVTTKPKQRIQFYLSYEQLYCDHSPRVDPEKSLQWFKRSLSVLMIEMLIGKKLDLHEALKDLKKISLEIEAGMLNIDSQSKGELKNQLKFVLEAPQAEIHVSSDEMTLGAICEEMNEETRTTSDKRSRRISGFVSDALDSLSLQGLSQGEDICEWDFHSDLEEDEDLHNDTHMLQRMTSVSDIPKLLPHDHPSLMRVESEGEEESEEEISTPRVIFESKVHPRALLKEEELPTTLIAE